MLLGTGNVILLVFTWLCGTATFCHLSCIYSSLIRTCIRIVKKIGQEKNQCICVVLIWFLKLNFLTESHLEIYLSIVPVWIHKWGNLFDLYKLGIIFQRYLNNISKCHPSTLINEWTAKRWFWTSKYLNKLLSS